MIHRNNPFNIRYTGKFVGETEAHNSFATFKSLVYGIRAAIRICQVYYKKYNVRTIEEFVHKWAPNGDGNNNEETYIQFITRYVPYSRSDVGFGNIINIEKLSDRNRSDLIVFLRAIARMESNTILSVNEIESAFTLYRESYPLLEK